MSLVSVLTGTVYAAVRSIRETVSVVHDPVLNKTVNSSTYSIYFNDFGTSAEGRAIYVVVTVIKNIGLIIVMVVVNLLLVYEMKKYLLRKSKLVAVKAVVPPPQNTGSTAVSSSTEPNVQIKKKKVEKPKMKKKDEETSQMNKFSQMVFMIKIIEFQQGR